jgi:hypothetical protein
VEPRADYRREISMTKQQEQLRKEIMSDIKTLGSEPFESDYEEVADSIMAIISKREEEIVNEVVDNFSYWIKGQDSVPWDEDVDEYALKLRAKYLTPQLPEEEKEGE